MEFFGAIAIGGKDPNDALAKDVSRAVFLKKAARIRVQDRRHKSLDLITNLMTHQIERNAFSIVRVDVRYPDGIVGIVLQYGSSNSRIFLCIETMSFGI